MNILFITSSRLGDAVLSTGILDHLLRAHPEARVTIVCGPIVTSLFEGVGQAREIIALKKEKHHRHWFKLWRMVAGRRWDIVVDLRNSFVSRAIWAGKRYIYTGRVDNKMHKVAQNSAVLGLSPPPTPRLWISDRQRDMASSLVPDGAPVLAFGPTANWIGKTWPVENFIKLFQDFILPSSDFSGWRFAVLAAPGEEAAAEALFKVLPEDHRINLIAKTDPGVAAATLARCQFYIGNDSGLMHMAAAAGIKTLGLFGPSWPHLYRPWGDHTAWVGTKENFAELTDFAGYDPKTLDRSLMHSLSVEMVADGLRDLVKR